MDENPCGEIMLEGFIPCDGRSVNLAKLNPSSPPAKPGVYTQFHNISGPLDPPIGTIQEMFRGLGSQGPFNTEQVIHAGNGRWLTTSVDQSEEAGRSTQSLVDKLKEIEELYELGEVVGFVISDDKAREYNRVEEELIRRFEQNPPLTVDTSPGSMYDTMWNPIREEMKRIAEVTKDRLNES